MQCKASVATPALLQKPRHILVRTRPGAEVDLGSLCSLCWVEFKVLRHRCAPLLEYYCRGREAGSSEFRPLDERTMANVRKDRRRRCPSLRSRAARVVRGRSQARCSGTGSLRARGQTKGHLQLSVKGRPCESSARGARPGPGSVAARARSRRRPHWRLVWRSPAFLGRVPQRQGWSARNSVAPLPCNPLALQSGLI